jgi:hypothetical protein
MKKATFNFIKTIIVEALLIFLFIFTINNFIGNADKTINADAIGYYDYLPSIFIHKDFIRKDKPYADNISFYHRLDQFDHISYVEYGDFKVNKYPSGTAILQTPFFLSEYFSSSKGILGTSINFIEVFFTPLYSIFFWL